MTVIMIYMTDFSVKHKRLSRNRWRHGHVTGGLEPGRGAALRISRPGMSRVRRTYTPGWRDRQASIDTLGDPYRNDPHGVSRGGHGGGWSWAGCGTGEL